MGATINNFSDIMKVILVLNVSQIVFHTKALIQILHDTFHYGHIVLNLTQTYFYS
jgi:hypothetical protein